MAHTKGEWSIWDSETNPDYPHITISAKGTPKIAKVIYNFVSTNEMNANAKLIAAAPDMLEALKEANDQLKIMHEYVSIIRNEILKNGVDCVSILDIDNIDDIVLTGKTAEKAIKKATE